MPKTKRKNRKLRNKKRTRKIHQKGGGLGSNVNKYIKHAKRNQAIWNNAIALYKPLNDALKEQQTKIENDMVKARNKDIGKYVKQKMKEAKRKFGILKTKLNKSTDLVVDSPPDQTEYQTTNLTFVYDPNDRDKQFNQDEIREPWNEWNEIRKTLIGLCTVVSNKTNNELINFLLNLYNPSNFGSCNRSASSGETKSQSVVEGNTIEPIVPQVVGYKLHEMKHNIACLGYLKQIKLAAEPHSGMEQTSRIDENLCIIQEKDVCKSIYKYLKEILYITDTTDDSEHLYTSYYIKKWNSQKDIEADKLNREYGKLVIQIEKQKNAYKEKQAKKKAKKQASKVTSESKQKSLADSVLVAKPLQSVRGPDDPRLEGEREEFDPSMSLDTPPPFVPPPPNKPPPNKKTEIQGESKKVHEDGGVEMTEITCSTHKNKSSCLRKKNKCHWNPINKKCKDIPQKFTEVYNLRELQKSLKMKINNLLIENLKVQDLNYLTKGKILKYRNDPDAWLPVEKDEDRLQRELWILELLKTIKNIKELLVKSEGKRGESATITKLDEDILNVQSTIDLLRRDYLLAMPNDPQDNTTGESKGTIPPENKNPAPPRRVYRSKKPSKGPKSLGDQVLGRETYAIGSKEAELAAASGPEPTGVSEVANSSDIHPEVFGSMVPEQVLGTRPTADAIPEAQAIKDKPDKVDEIRPACSVQIMPIPKPKKGKDKTEKRKKRKETKRACEGKGGEVVKVGKKSVTCKICPVNDLLERIKELEIRQQ